MPFKKITSASIVSLKQAGDVHSQLPSLPGLPVSQRGQRPKNLPVYGTICGIEQGRGWDGSASIRAVRQPPGKQIAGTVLLLAGLLSSFALTFQASSFRFTTLGNHFTMNMKWVRVRSFDATVSNCFFYYITVNVFMWPLSLVNGSTILQRSFSFVMRFDMPFVLSVFVLRLLRPDILSRHDPVPGQHTCL